MYVCSLSDPSNRIFVPTFPTEALRVPKFCTQFCAFQGVTVHKLSLLSA
jgi:hypothetical protein